MNKLNNKYPPRRLFDDNLYIDYTPLHNLFVGFSSRSHKISKFDKTLHVIDKTSRVPDNTGSYM